MEEEEEVRILRLGVQTQKLTRGSTLIGRMFVMWLVKNMLMTMMMTMTGLKAEALVEVITPSVQFTHSSCETLQRHSPSHPSPIHIHTHTDVPDPRPN